MEYLDAWKRATPDNPIGICGPIGPTEQLPLVARLVNELELDLSNAHFWGMDEWLGDDGKAVPVTHPLSFERADRELLFDRLEDKLKIPEDDDYEAGMDAEIAAQETDGSLDSFLTGVYTTIRPFTRTFWFWKP